MMFHKYLGRKWGNFVTNACLVVENYNGKVATTKQTKYTFQK
jgi:hypothetical protein